MLDGLLQAIQNLEEYDFGEIAEEITATSSDEILQLIKYQLQNGIDGSGEPIYLIRRGKKVYNYSIITVENKLQYGFGIGAIVDHITLYGEGDFYNSLFVKTYDDGDFSILSRDVKAPKIFRRSGEHILQLAPISGEVVQERYKDLFQYSLDQALTG